VKSADHRHALIAPLLRQIVGLDDKITGALGRAEKGGLFLFENIEVPQDSDTCQCLVGEMFS